MRTDDGHIIRECLNGDSASFGLLVDKYKAGIFALALSILHNFQDAEDVTQEVFIKAYKCLNTLKRWDSFIIWLRSTTINLCKDKLREKSRRRDVPINEQTPRVIENASLDSYRNEQSSSWRNDALDSLDKALSSLPEQYQQVLTLHYLGGMSGEEISKFLSVSHATVRQRLSRAREHLKAEVLAMMGETFEQQRLQATFTFRIVEMVKRIKIHPVSTMKGLPWGLSLATGIIIAVMSFNPTLVSFDHIGTPIYSPLPSESKVLKVGEIPVDVVKTSNIAFISSNMGKGKGGEPENMQNAFFMAPKGEGGTWTKKTDMPEVIGYHSAGVVNDKIYLIGGGDSAGNASKSVYEYDPATGKGIWLGDAADMPTPRGYSASCVLNNRLYVIGGFEPGRVNSNAVEEYDPNTGKWKKKANMIEKRTALAVSAVNGKIYAIGGFSNNKNLSTMEEYDPLNDKWIGKADMPIANSHMSNSVVKGKIYVIGGLDQGLTPLSTVLEYDPANDIWTKKEDMPTARCLLSTCSVNGEIYAIGGVDARDNTSFSAVEVFNPTINEWSKTSDMPTKRNGLTVNAVNGKIYAIGGWNKDLGWLSAVEEYDTGFSGESVEVKGKLPKTWGNIKSK